MRNVLNNFESKRLELKSRGKKKLGEWKCKTGKESFFARGSKTCWEKEIGCSKWASGQLLLSGASGTSDISNCLLTFIFFRSLDSPSFCYFKSWCERTEKSPKKIFFLKWNIYFFLSEIEVISKHVVEIKEIKREGRKKEIYIYRIYKDFFLIHIKDQP